MNSARLQALAAAVLFSTGGAAVKSASLTSWQIAGFRSAVAAAVILLFLPAARRGWNHRVLAAACAYAATLVTYVHANKLTTAAAATFLQAAAPLYLLLLSPWVLQEPVRRRDLAFVILVACGLAALLAGAPPPAVTAPDPARGNWFGLASGLAWALTLIGLRWAGTRGGGAGMAAVAGGNLLAFACCLPFAFPVRGASPAGWLVVAYLGVFQIGLAYLLLTAAARKLTALELSLLVLAEPALNPLWALLVHGERPGAWTAIGGALILGATLVRAFRAARFENS
jgi:drug/metabolite transporter (DMT)-like permease